MEPTYQDKPVISSSTNVVLHNVLEGDQPNIPINLGVDQDGILLNVGVTYRVVIENIEGKLMVHVWATLESIDHDPTHSIEIER